MNCIGIDPSYAKPVAYAYKAGDVWHGGEFDVYAMEVPSLEEAKVNGVTTAIIEDGYVGCNMKVSMRLSEARARIEVLCQRLGWDIVRVAPTTWHSVLAVNGHVPKDRASLKAQSKLRATAEIGKPVKSDDLADAICLAVWGAANG